MNKLLASAFILPGFYAVQQITYQNQIAHAKSSGSSKKGSSGLFKSSSTKSLTSNVSKKSSTTHSVKPAHIRSDGKRQFVNRKQHARSQQQNKQLSLMGLFGVLGVVTRYFYRYERLRYSLPIIKKALLGAEPINLSVLSNKFDKKLIYGTGNILTPPSNGNYLTDKLFGVSATSENALMLRRHVEIFKDNSDSEKPGDWKDAKYIQAFDSSMFKDYMKERAVLPEQVLIGEYELQPEQIIKLAPEEIKKLKIDSDVVEEVFQELSDDRASVFSGRNNRFKKVFGQNTNQETKNEDSQTLSQKEPSNQADQVIEFVRQKVDETSGEKSLSDSYEHHPFKLAETEGKSIAYTDDYIYICKDMKELEEGDMRISFSEIKPILQASIIAEQDGGSFRNYFIKALEGLKLNLRLFSNGKEQDVRFDCINIIEEGKIEKLDLIEKYVKKQKSQSKMISALLASLIFMVYSAIIDHIGASLNPFNWFGKNAAARREKSKQNAISKKGNTISFTKKNNISPLSYMIAAPFAGAHIGIVSLFALASTFPAVIATGVVGGFLLFSTLKNNQEESMYINSLNGTEEDELHEDYQEDKLENHHEDNVEERILGLVQNSNKQLDE